MGTRVETPFRRAGAAERYGSNANNHYPYRTTFRNASDQPADRALLVSRGTNCLSRTVLRWRQMADSHRPQEEIGGVQQAGCCWRKVAALEKTDGNLQIKFFAISLFASPSPRNPIPCLSHGDAVRNGAARGERAEGE